MKQSAHQDLTDSDDWLERHRPRSLDDMALEPSVRQLLKVLLSERKLRRHLLLWGPPATGKTSLARILALHYFGENAASRILHIDAARHRGIDIVRDVLEPHLATRGGLFRKVDPDWWGLIAVSEADGLTTEFHRCLNDLMEDYVDTHRFILTTNAFDQIPQPIRSRCRKIKMDTPPVEERARYLSNLLRKEGLQADTTALESFAAHYKDMRDLVRDAQDSWSLHGELRGIVQPTEATVEMWHEPVDGAALFDELRSLFERHAILPQGASILLPLFVAFTYSHEQFFFSPILAITSPTMESGKSTVLELLSYVVHNPMPTSNMTDASLFRSLPRADADDEDGAIEAEEEPAVGTIIADEADTWLNTRKETRSLWNAGHGRRLAWVSRVVGGKVVRFSTRCPKVIALIRADDHDLPPTVASRCHIIAMQRRAPTEVVDPLRREDLDEALRPIRLKVARWCYDHAHALKSARPDVPDGLGDREADNWRPLLAIADVAGDRWPSVTRDATLSLRQQSDAVQEQSVLALTDVWQVFGECGDQRIPSQVLVSALAGMEHRPWPGWISPKRLARLLKPFGIRPRDIYDKWNSTDSKTLKGYQRRDFEDVVVKYIDQAL